MRTAVFCALMFSAAAFAQQEGMVPFDLPAAMSPQSQISLAPSAPISPDGPRVVVTGDRFTVEGRRIRVYGLNISGRISPSKSDAVELADRLAQAGVNSMRFHGMETAGWFQAPEDKLTQEQKDQRDQFDFFVAQLAKRGIYSNFNLHVSRRYSEELGLAKWVESNDKIIDIFTPKLVEAQKNFARRLLEHVNPYRKVRYLDDPAVAFVEINNENSLFLWNAAELLPQQPEYNMNILAGRFNEFLKKRYDSTDKLSQAWNDLDENEKLEDGSVRLFGKDEKPDSRRVVDRMLCLMEVEQDYWDDMYDFLKNTLGYKGLVTGTILFGPCNLYAQRNMDWIDAHAYWGHPRWAKDVRRWDQTNWTLPRAAMVDSPEKTVTDLDEISGILFYLAAQQLENKPFTVSEYNHCAPNDYQAECVPVLSSFAAVQDWDGLWFFLYENNRDTVHWFDYAYNPAKWSFMQAGAEMFRDSGLTALAKTVHLGYSTKGDELESLVRHQLRRNYDMFTTLCDEHGAKWNDFIEQRLVVNISCKNKQTDTTIENASKITWDKDADGKGLYFASGPGARVWIGHACRLDGQYGLTVTKPDFAVVTLTSLDAKPLNECRKALITAIFRAENTGMVFNEKRDSVGKSWGKKPVLAEPVEGILAGIADLKGKWKCYALKPDGSVSEAVPVTYDDKGLPKIELSAKYKTIWYVLERQ